MSIARIRKGDKVVVIRGDEAGRTGTVEKIDTKRGTAIVPGINQKKKTLRRSETTPQGGIVDIDAPIALAKLMPYDEDAKKGSRVSAATKDGKKARQLKTSGKII